MNTIDVGYTYLETMGLELIAGRNFSKDFPSDEHEAFIINESAAKFLGWKNPVGKRLEFIRPQRQSASSKVIGVVKDFHYQSLHHPIEPLIIGMRWNMQNVLAIKHLTVRIHPGDISGALAFLEAKTRELVPNEPFRYQFSRRRFRSILPRRRSDLPSDRLSQHSVYCDHLPRCIGGWPLFRLSSA